MSEPLVTCLLPVFNRYPAHGHLVEEAVESFLRQDWPRKELILCNDTPGQELVFDHNEVRVFNRTDRFERLALKLRWMIEQASGGLLCRWDDDDISLPWRLSVSVEQLGDALEWHPCNYWYTPASGPQMDVRHGNDHIQAIWRRELLAKIPGGYPDVAWSGYEDQAFAGALRSIGMHGAATFLRPEQMYYLYRWGVSPTHLSGTGGEAKMQAFYQQLGQQPIAAGPFEIVPHWRRDYVAWTRAKLVPRFQ